MNIKTPLILLAILSLSACLPPDNHDPKQVARNYWAAIVNGDHETAKELVSINSQSSFEDYLNLPENEKVAVQHVEVDDEYASVASVLNPAGKTPNDKRHFDTVLVLENGYWKVDAARTQIPPPKSSTEKQLEELAEKLSEGMQNNIESLDEVMSEGMQLLNDVLREGSNEMGESLLKGMKDLNESMRQSIDNLKQQREKNRHVDEDTGEGML